MLETDTMAALRTTVLEEQQLSNLAASLLQEPVVSVIAFRGNVTSPPMYIRSNDPSLTTETGIVDQLGLTIALGGLYACDYASLEYNLSWLFLPHITPFKHI